MSDEIKADLLVTRHLSLVTVIASIRSNALLICSFCTPSAWAHCEEFCALRYFRPKLCLSPKRVGWRTLRALCPKPCARTAKTLCSCFRSTSRLIASTFGTRSLTTWTWTGEGGHFALAFGTRTRPARPRF